MIERRYIVLALMVLVLGVIPSYCQPDKDSYQYNSEFTWGINKNTYGGLIGGFVFKKGRKLDERVLETYGLEIMNVKHPQERRVNSTQGNFFILGKSNYLFALRLQYGRDYILFKKAPQQGVEVKAVFAAGPSIGIVAPYYVEIKEEPGRIQYHPSRVSSATSIIGTGRLFEGIGDSQLKIGANIKAALNFEMGTIKSQVTGFEAGLIMDMYASKIEMVPLAENYSIYPILYVTLFYGSRK